MGLMQSIVWPSIEGFETHLKRMHHDENADELIMKYVYSLKPFLYM